MAIVFDKPLSEINLLNSHNNNVVEFHSNNVLGATDCDIIIDGVTLNITPDPDGLFRYNLKDIVKTLINPTNFADDYIPDIENNGYVYLDSNLYKIVSVVFNLNLSGGSFETSSKNYIFTKSVKQPDNFSRTVIDTTVEKLAFLLPFEDYSVKSYYATYHKGFPFDLSLYSNIARTITIANKTNGLDMEIDLEKGVNRIFICDGSQNWTLEDDLPLVTGFNDLEFQISPSEYKSLLLEKKETSCATYLKYYSDYGSYFYYLFDEIYKESEKTKILDSLDRDLEDISETFEKTSITGKESNSTRTLLIEGMTDRQKKYLLPIIRSPRVELYTRDQYVLADEESWKGVILNEGDFLTNTTKKKLQDFSGAITIINNTLTL